ncbi:hypothetical protein Hanom_Chr10g00920541 [Helianthus anomalus]
MHHVVALIAERQKGTCTNRPLSRLLSAVYILTSSGPILALLLMGFTEYDDDDLSQNPRILIVRTQNYPTLDDDE